MLDLLDEALARSSSASKRARRHLRLHTRADPPDALRRAEHAAPRAAAPPDRRGARRRCSPTRLDSHLTELAHHLFQAAPGGDVAKAVDYATRAGDAAMAPVAYEEAARSYEMALQVLEPEPRRPESRHAGAAAAPRPRPASSRRRRAAATHRGRRRSPGAPATSTRSATPPSSTTVRAGWAPRPVSTRCTSHCARRRRPAPTRLQKLPERLACPSRAGARCRRRSRHDRGIPWARGRAREAVDTAERSGSVDARAMAMNVASTVALGPGYLEGSGQSGR